MPISNIVKLWCKHQNTQTCANRWFVLWLLGGLLVCWAILWATNAAQWAILAAWSLCWGLYLAWFKFAPKRRKYSQLRSSYEFVPDSLLVEIAQSREVSDGTKAMIAEVLKQNCGISFKQLFDVERRVENSAAREHRERGDGYQKMLAFGQVDDRKRGFQ